MGAAVSARADELPGQQEKLKALYSRASGEAKEV